MEPIRYRTISGHHDYQWVVWENLPADSEGVAIASFGEMIAYSKATFVAYGDFDGAQVQIMGRLGDDGQFDLLLDYFGGGSLYFARREIKTTLDLVGEIKPVVEGGGKDTKINVAGIIAR
jgi:hypothetical protein